MSDFEGPNFHHHHLLLLILNYEQRNVVVVKDYAANKVILFDERCLVRDLVVWMQPEFNELEFYIN